MLRKEVTVARSQNHPQRNNNRDRLCKITLHVCQLCFCTMTLFTLLGNCDTLLRYVKKYQLRGHRITNRGVIQKTCCIKELYSFANLRFHTVTFQLNDCETVTFSYVMWPRNICEATEPFSEEQFSRHDYMLFLMFTNRCFCTLLLFIKPIHVAN